MKNALIILLISALANIDAHAAKDDHGGHSHEEHLHDHHDHGNHDHDHGEHESHHDHNAEIKIKVTAKQAEQLGIRNARVQTGAVHKEIRVPGEIKINSDQVAHVVPRAAGIVREVQMALGQNVQPGDILAWIESDEYARAKLSFYAKETEVGCCEIKLPRAKSIYENVGKLIEMLENSESAKDIAKMEGLEMGAYRGQILTAHAAFTAARTTYEQEANLRAKKISSERELLNAETAMKQAQAKYQAIMDTARYETLVEYSEALQERQVVGFDAVAAEKQLRLKGATDKVVAELKKLVPSPDTLKPCLCDDPDCAAGKLPDLSEILGQDARFGWYALTAPISGRLIEKHIVMGESIDTDAEVFTVADLSSVWVDLAISQENISVASEGYSVTVLLPDGLRVRTRISFVSPVVDANSRTALARATLDNRDDRFRPGTFIEAIVHAPVNQNAVIIPKGAVQLVDDTPCVFVLSEDSVYEVRKVVTGSADEAHIEIVGGLQAGEVIAVANAFHLKAEYIKTAQGDLGDHHGHSH